MLSKTKQKKNQPDEMREEFVKGKERKKPENTLSPTAASCFRESRGAAARTPGLGLAAQLQHSRERTGASCPSARWARGFSAVGGIKQALLYLSHGFLQSPFQRAGETQLLANTVPALLPPGTGTARGTQAASSSSKYAPWGSSLCSVAPRQEVTTALSVDQAHLLIA